MQKLEKLADKTSTEFKSGSGIQDKELGLGDSERLHLAASEQRDMECSWLASALHSDQSWYDHTSESYFFHSSSK